MNKRILKRWENKAKFFPVYLSYHLKQEQELLLLSSSTWLSQQQATNNKQRQHFNEYRKRRRRTSQQNNSNNSNNVQNITRGKPTNNSISNAQNVTKRLLIECSHTPMMVCAVVCPCAVQIANIRTMSSRTPSPTV